MNHYSRIPRGVAFIFILTLLWLLAVVLNIWESLRGDYGWRWGYVPPDSFQRILPLITLMVIYILGCYILFQRAKALISWILLLGLGLIAASIYTHHAQVIDTLYLRTLSTGTTGWHYAGVQMDERGTEEMLRKWPQVMESFKIYSAHVTISPPGMALAYHALNQTLETLESLANWAGPSLRFQQCHNYTYNQMSNAQLTSSAIGGILTPIIALFAILPLWTLGRRYFSETVARWSIIWWPLVPAVLIFQPYPSVIYPFLTLSMTLVLMQGLLQNQRKWVFGAGVMMSAFSFINFSILPMLLLAGFLALGTYFYDRQQHKRNWWWPFEMGVWYGLGLITVWLGYYLLYGVTFFEILEATFANHLDLERPYFPWLFLHLYDFAFFLGWPLLIFGIWGLWHAVKKTRHKNIIIIGSALILTLLILDVSGTARGETGRVWLFFMPYFLLLAAYCIQQLNNPMIGWLLTSVQGGIVIGLVAFIPAINTDLTMPPNLPLTPTSPSKPYIENGSIFDDKIVLQAFTGQVIPANDSENKQALLQLWIRWKAIDNVEYPYYIGILPISPDREAQQAIVIQPFEDGKFPMTCWSPEYASLVDYYEIPIENFVEGEWWASIQILTRDGITLEVQHQNGTTEQQVGIGPFQSQ